MVTKGPVMKWRFSFLEMFGFGISVVSITSGIILWSMSSFESKAHAKEVRQASQVQVQELKQKDTEFQKVLTDVASDVSYIRGRLEPKKHD